MTHIVQHLRQDVIYALRQLRRNPGFAVVAVLTLALGIGANTAIFSLLDQALLRSLPVHDPQQLVVLEGTGDAWEGHSSSHGGDKQAYFSYPMYRDLLAKADPSVITGMIATSPADLDITVHNASQIASGEVVSGNYFALLGTRPYRGRLLTQSDDTAPGANPVAVVSYHFWQDKLGADPSLVGQTISLNGHPFEVIGISAPGFHSAVWGETPALFVPMSMLEEMLPGRGGRLTNHKDRWMNILARMAPGVTTSQAQAALAPLWHALRAEELKALGDESPHFVSEFLTNSRLLVLPGSRGFSYQRDNLKTPLLVVMAMAALVLLIASVNVGSLLLVRSAGRIREFSLRSALGANQGRILAQLLLEGLLIGVFGGCAGLLLAPLALHALVDQLAGPDNVTTFSSSLDARVLLFNFAVAIGVSLLFSLAPALQLRRPNLTTALRGSNSSASGGLLSLRRIIVCVQIGLSVLLLAASGLFVRTMQRLRSVDVGFNPTHLVGFSISPQLAGYVPARIPALSQRVVETLSTLPGVRSVAATDGPEFTDSSAGGSVMFEGYVPQQDEDIDIQKSYHNADFFSAMQIPLLAGRTFTATDDATHPLVAMVNEALAKRYFGSVRNALGKHLVDGGDSKPVYDTEIVGIVPDFKQTGIRDQVGPSVFRPLLQPVGKRAPDQIFFYLRTVLPTPEITNTIRRTMQQLDPTLALDNLRTMDDQIDENLSNDRLTELLAISFGVLATLLAGIGLYGVLAYVTAQRTREIGVRIALGSSRIAISRIVLIDVLKLAGTSLVVALPCAFGLARLLKSQLFGVSSSDPTTFVAVALLVALVAIVSALEPAHRAATVDPIEALRNE
jgi:putative ABC transport system permease protein